MNETKGLLKILRQYHEWYIGRAAIDRETKGQAHRATTEKKQLEALRLMSDEEREATIEWLKGYTTALLAVKEMGWWSVESSDQAKKEKDEERIFGMGEMMRTLKGVEKEEGIGETAASQPWQALTLDFSNLAINRTTA